MRHAGRGVAKGFMVRHAKQNGFVGELIRFDNILCLGERKDVAVVRWDMKRSTDPYKHLGIPMQLRDEEGSYAAGYPLEELLALGHISKRGGEWLS